LINSSQIINLSKPFYPQLDVVVESKWIEADGPSDVRREEKRFQVEVRPTRIECFQKLAAQS
jgi:hypothetical protein